MTANGAPAKEEQPRVTLRRILLPLLVGIEPVEHRLAGRGVVDHPVQAHHHSLRIDVRVVGQERADSGERHLLVVGAIVPRQNQVREPGECSMP
jgi:hypothetical protein